MKFLYNGKNEKIWGRKETQGVGREKFEGKSIGVKYLWLAHIYFGVIVGPYCFFGWEELLPPSKL
jgi:hypothetical protein